MFFVFPFSFYFCWTFLDLNELFSCKNISISLHGEIKITHISFMWKRISSFDVTPLIIWCYPNKNDNYWGTLVWYVEKINFQMIQSSFYIFIMNHLSNWTIVLEAIQIEQCYSKSEQPEHNSIEQFHWGHSPPQTRPPIMNRVFNKPTSKLINRHSLNQSKRQ